MSLRDKLKKASTGIALGAALVAPTAMARPAQTNQAPAPIMQTVSENWTWMNPQTAAHDKAVYDSLPKEYRNFANKSFDTRMEMQEEWEQRDWKKRQKTQGNDAGRILYSDKIGQDLKSGKLNPEQAEMARQMTTLGRPLGTVDTGKPYAEQLRDCGFDVMAKVAAGNSALNMSARDQAIYRVQEADSKMLTSLDQNSQARHDVLVRTAQEENDAHHRPNLFQRMLARPTKVSDPKTYTPATQYEKINGRYVVVPMAGTDTAYSYHDEMTRRVANKLAQEEQRTQAALKSKSSDR